MSISRRALFVLGTYSLCASAFGCGNSNTLRHSPKTLRLIGHDPSTLDPAHLRDTTAASYACEIFAGLTRIGTTLLPTPDLASGWTTSRNGLRYVFNLRREAMFQDGTPLTAEDVIWSWTRALAPATRSLSAHAFLGHIAGATEFAAGRARSIHGLKVLSPVQLEVTLQIPTSFFPSQIAVGPALIVNRRNVSSSVSWWRQPNGSGPYQLEDWIPEHSLSLTRADTCGWRPQGPNRVQFDQLEPAESLLRYETDSLDLAGVHGQDVDRFRDAREPRNRQLISTPDLAIRYIGFNVNTEPFDDINIRRALAHAVDRARITTVTLRQTHIPASGIIPPGLTGHRGELRGLQFEPESARQELARSRYRVAAALPPITLVVPGDSLVTEKLVEAVTHTWQSELGIEMKVEILGFDEMVSALDDPNHTIQTFLLGWSADIPDPYSFIDVLFRSTSSDNHSRLNDPYIDLLLDRAQAAATNSERAHHYSLAEDKIIDEAIAVPLYFPVSHELVQPWVTGYTGRPLVREWITDIAIQN